jgi:hypothetical protein
MEQNILIAGLIFCALCAPIVLGWMIGRSERDEKPIRRWCVFDPDDPPHQLIVTARTPDEAVGKAAREVFDLDVEEAQ